MASAEIHKEKVFDARILQPEQRFAVVQGGANNTAAPYNAIAATASQHSFNINVPSLNIFTQRNLLWNTDVYQSFTSTTAIANTSQWSAGNPITSPVYLAAPGKDLALCSYPLMSMLSTAQATINDTSVVANLGDTLKEILRLRDYKKNRLASSCPKIMDRYAANRDGNGTVASALGGFDNFVGEGSVPNGAWFQFDFTDSTGAVLSGGSNAPTSVGAYQIPAGVVAGGGNWVMYLNGVPIRTPAPQGGQTPQQMLTALATPASGAAGGTPVADAGAGTAYTLYVKWSSTESLVLSPFIFASGAEYSEVGAFGLNNVQVVLNIDQNLAARVLRSTGSPSAAISNVQFFQPTSGNSAFQNSRIMVNYITPPLSLELPALSSVPYIEYPRYINSGFSAFDTAPGAANYTRQTLSSQTITVPYIPDAVVIYAKPQNYSFAGSLGPNQYGDFYLPIDYQGNPIAISWDNRAGILSTHTQPMLHKMSLANGLDMDYETWSGLGYTGDADTTVSQRVPLVGGPLVIRYGTDIPLLPGQSPSIIGNYTLQYTVTIRNPFPGVPIQPVLYTMILGSGFFQTRAGSSRVIKGILTEADVVAAPMAPEADVAGMRRLVGHGIFDRLGSMLTKAKHIYTATKPAMSALKDALPEGKVKNVMGAVGYGPAGAGSAGAGRRKGLADRLL